MLPICYYYLIDESLLCSTGDLFIYNLTSFQIPFCFATIHSRCLTHSHSSLRLRCDPGSCSGDVASSCFPNPPRYCHGDCFSWRHPDEDAEDVDPATDHFQFNHRYSVIIYGKYSRLLKRTLDTLLYVKMILFT